MCWSSVVVARAVLAGYLHMAAVVAAVAQSTFKLPYFLQVVLTRLQSARGALYIPAASPAAFRGFLLPVVAEVE
jgi:hypothetical protein